jgi:2-oxoglutarate ferredoxin oxidoreductase subunit gamma
MNNASILRFGNQLVNGGTLIYDSSTVNKEIDQTDKKVFSIPATKMASQMGYQTFANIILLGCFIKNTQIVAQESILQALTDALPPSKHYLISEELRALELGMNSCGHDGT